MFFYAVKQKKTSFSLGRFATGAAIFPATYFYSVKIHRQIEFY